MSRQPLVTVVVPVLNGERFLKAALQSVLDQDYDPIELIVVDDGSTDESVAIVAGVPRVTLARQQNRGPAAARNAGISACHGELISFLDHDDLLPPAAVPVRVRYLASNPTVRCVLGHQRAFAEEGTELPRWVSGGGEAGADAFVPFSSMMLSRSVWEQVGPFDERLRSGEDADWLFRARAKGIAIEVLPDVVLLRRFHGANASYETGALQSGLIAAARARVADRRATVIADD